MWTVTFLQMSHVEQLITLSWRPRWPPPPPAVCVQSLWPVAPLYNDGKNRGFHTGKGVSGFLTLVSKFWSAGVKFNMMSNGEHKNGPVHSWPRVKILTPRQLCENSWWEPANIKGLWSGHSLQQVLFVGWVPSQKTGQRHTLDGARVQSCTERFCSWKTDKSVYNSNWGDKLMNLVTVVAGSTRRNCQF